MDRKRILVIDDDEVLRYTYQRALSEDYDISLAEDSDQALALRLKGNYDLILLDLKMPGLDPFEVLEWVKANRPKTSVLVITGFGSSEALQDVIRRGADGYLIKPFESGTLEAAVKKCLDKRAKQGSEILAGKKVLIIDDDEDVCDYFATVLEAKQAIVVRALDGLSGLDLARKEKPDLIFLDIVLPGMNGLEVCRNLKESQGPSPTPVILITSRLNSDYAERAREAGSDAFITKLLDPFQVVEAAETLLFKGVSKGSSLKL